MECGVSCDQRQADDELDFKIANNGLARSSIGKRHISLDDLWLGQVSPFLGDKVEVARVLAAGKRVQRSFAALIVESKWFGWDHASGAARDEWLRPAELDEMASKFFQSKAGNGTGLIIKPADSSNCQGISLVLPVSDRGRGDGSMMLVPMEHQVYKGLGVTTRPDRAVVGTLDNLLSRALRQASSFSKTKRVLVSQRIEYCPHVARQQQPPSPVPELRIVFHRGLPLHASLHTLLDPDMIVWRRDFAQNRECARQTLPDKLGSIADLRDLQNVEALHDKVWQLLGLTGTDTQTQRKRQEFHELVQKLCAIPDNEHRGSEVCPGSALGLLEALLADWNESQELERQLAEWTGEAAALVLLRGRMDLLLECCGGEAIVARLGEIQPYTCDVHQTIDTVRQKRMVRYVSSSRGNDRWHRITAEKDPDLIND
ncbi:unnamed protein product [Polarella glacialis]|uniref:Uncharacterized protein n=1 Tax=Polarella glacialis TaxID=89957 RepID=A0A813I2K0_POLGL|nr:unnamed protein product [Polarella glacialis]